MLSISNLLYEIEDKILFENASLKLSCGQYQLVGNNGVGKTSLLNLITNNVKSQAGDIKITEDYVYISQEPILLNNMSVSRNVKFFNTQFKDQILKELETFGIDKHKKIKTLSGGQKQLVYLLICLNSKYNLYLIDEPFNNLDKNRVEYIKALIMSKNNVLVIDHINQFNFKPVYIEKRGFRCEH